MHTSMDRWWRLLAAGVCSVAWTAKAVDAQTSATLAEERSSVPTGRLLDSALHGGWRSQAGESTVRVQGDRDEAGPLTVRWRFAVQ